MNDEIIFTDGMFFNEPSEKAPDFIKGTINIEPKQFTEWLRKNYNKDEKYIRIDLKVSKQGKAYSALSTFKPNQGSQSNNNGFHARSEQSQGKSSQGAGPENFKSDNFETDGIPF